MLKKIFFTSILPSLFLTSYAMETNHASHADTAIGDVRITGQNNAEYRKNLDLLRLALNVQHKCFVKLEEYLQVYQQIYILRQEGLNNEDMSTIVNNIKGLSPAEIEILNSPLGVSMVKAQKMISYVNVSKTLTAQQTTQLDDFDNFFSTHAPLLNTDIFQSNNTFYDHIKFLLQTRRVMTQVNQPTTFDDAQEMATSIVTYLTDESTKADINSLGRMCQLELAQKNQLDFLLHEYIKHREMLEKVFTTLPNVIRDLEHEEKTKKAEVITQLLLAEEEQKSKKKTLQQPKKVIHRPSSINKAQKAEVEEPVTALAYSIPVSKSIYQPLVTPRSASSSPTKEKSASKPSTSHISVLPITHQPKELDACINLTNIDGIEFVFYKVGDAKTPIKFIFDDRVARQFESLSSLEMYSSKENDYQGNAHMVKIAHRAPKQIKGYLEKLGITWHRPNTSNPDQHDTVYSLPCHISFENDIYIGALEMAIDPKGLCYHWYVTRSSANPDVRRLISQGYWQWTRSTTQK